MTALPHLILSGEWQAAGKLDPRILSAGESLFTDAEWQDAAEQARTGDDSNLEHMLERNALFEEFARFARPRNIDLDRFDEWLADREAWRTSFKQEQVFADVVRRAA